MNRTTLPKVSDQLEDQSELQAFGYKQQLARTMGKFSSFAISFSLISIITGIFANFSFGIQQVGGQLLWSWSLVGVGQLLVALVMADLAGRFPLAGYGYQWTSRLTNSHFGYFVGWLLLMQFITGFPGVCQAFASTLQGFIPATTGDNWFVTWITIGVITLTTVIHLFGIRIVSLVNDAGVYAEIVGVIFIILVLSGAWLAAGEYDFSIVFQGAADDNRGLTMSAFALSLLVGAWCLTGFEAAADLAEETHEPRKTVPRAVIFSQVSAALAGFLMIAIFLLLAGDLNSIQHASSPLISILQQQLGTSITSFIGIIILLSIFACGVACMATATRLIYSLARDNMLPLSDHLMKVDDRSKSPRNASIAVWALACVFVLLVRKLAMITNISAVAGYLGYCGILWATIRTTKLEQSNHGFSLGRWRHVIQWVALLWTASVVAALTLPATQIEGMEETHLPAKSTFLALSVGAIIYFATIRSRIRRGVAGPPQPAASLQTKGSRTK